MPRKTTVLLTTYHRPEALRRLLAFWKRSAFDREVIVLDSSPPEIKEVNRKICREELASELLAYREFPETVFPFEKWHRLMSEVTTPYVIFAADDDFLIPSALTECEDFLDQHEDYAVCQGFHFAFRKHENSLRIFEDSLTTSNDAATPEERLLKQFGHYGHFTYGLRRMSLWNKWPKHLQDATESMPLEAGGFQEMIDAMLCLISGKVKRLPILQSVRNGQPTVESGWRKAFVFGPHFSSAIVSFKSILIEALVLQGKRGAEDYDFLLNEGLKIYFGTLFRPSSKADLPPDFPLLASAGEERKALEKVIEESDFKLPELKAVLQMVEKNPIGIDVSNLAHLPLGSSRYPVFNWLNATLAASSVDDFNHQKVPSLPKKRNRLAEIIRQPRKATAGLFEQYFGSKKGPSLDR